MTKKILLGLTLMLILLVPTTVLSAHAQTANPGPTPPADGDTFKYNAAGSTFIYPLMDKWRVEYNTLYSGIKLNYQSIGSGAGIKLYVAKKVDFGASDAPLQSSDYKKGSTRNSYYSRINGCNSYDLQSSRSSEKWTLVNGRCNS